MKNIIAAVLLLMLVSLSFKHAWDTLHYRNNPESMKMMESLGISETFIPYLAIIVVAVGTLLLFPRTFFLSNLLNAFLVVMIMGLALRAVLAGEVGPAVQRLFDAALEAAGAVVR